MPESNCPLVERASPRVLAGAAHSSNAEGADPSAGEKVDPVWREHMRSSAGGAPYDARSGRTNGVGWRCGDLAQNDRNRDRRTGRLTGKHKLRPGVGASAVRLEAARQARIIGKAKLPCCSRFGIRL